MCVRSPYELHVIPHVISPYAQLKGLHLQLGEDHKQLQLRHSALYEERVGLWRQFVCDDKQVGRQAGRGGYGAGGPMCPYAAVEGSN